MYPLVHPVLLLYIDNELEVSMQKKLLVILISSVIGNAWAETHDTPSDTLDDVIITATRSSINTSEAPGSVTVISRKEIKEKGAENVLDIIRGTAGINLQGVGTGGRKTISLRGMESRHTLILIDGKRIPSSNDVIGPNTDYQYDWISTENIERVEVVRGPMSVLYGADALGGVVNIITRKPTEKLQGNLKITSFGVDGNLKKDGDGHNLEFNLSGRASDTVQFSLDAQESRRASVESILKPDESAIEGRKKQQFTIGLDWQPKEGHNIEFDLTQGQEDRWYDTRTRKKKLYQSQYNLDREQLSLGWKGSLGEADASLRVYQSTIDVSNKATNGVRATSPQKLTDTTLEGNISFPIGQKQLITTGFEQRKEKLKNSRLKTGEDDVTLKSFYLQDEIDLSDSLLFTLGARLDDHEVFGNEVSPRASIVWNASQNWILKGSYGHGFRAPTIKQSSSDYVFQFGPNKISGNSDLKPETNNTIELGANYSTDKYSIDIAIFDNKVKDLIELTGPVTDRVYQNISEARLKGLELSNKILLSKQLTLKTNYQYLDAKDGDGNRLKHRPRHTISGGLNWDNNDWQFNLNAEYLSGQIIEHNRVTNSVPGYTLWNIGARKRINKNLEFAAGIDNVTDVRLEDKSAAFRHEEYPRTLKLELRSSF